VVTVYGVLRLLHGWWRWAVILSGLVVLVRSLAGVRSRRWTLGDERASRVFVGTGDLQLLLGLILYFGFSPFWPAVRDSFPIAMKDASARFFGIEHEIAMLLALIALHVGHARARRATEAAASHRALLVSTLLFFAVALWAIPWPWRAIGRPLFRTLL
jgi:hypothetical protein